ncbi:hypothetical protein QG516_25035 [Pedobacter gandavensis]|uniref:hypothetical protein n=1 Tax=Pedobacter TaxID=84567 RepID=UPI001C98FBDE|nr:MULTISPECIES: hypothetical protein [Pedobacter]WGQ09783.1 hypothetical protein QG516_25035 [Pedobacter gandavensis]
MEKITIGNIVDFRNRSSASQISLINQLNRPKNPEEKSGGHYWVSALSAIKNAVKLDNHQPIADKISILEDTLETEQKHINKVRWQRNIDMLHRFEDYDFSRLQPKSKFRILKGLDEKIPLIIQGLPIKVTPDVIFAFEDNGVKKIGSTMFVGKLKEYNLEDLAMFNDALYRYLTKNKDQDFEVCKDCCIVVDVINLNFVSFSQIASGKLTTHLENTLKDIKRLAN